MQPFNEAIEQIFIPSGKLSNQIVTFTCDHVINAKKQLAVYPLGVHSHQSNGEVFSLDFTYQVSGIICEIFYCLVLEVWIRYCIYDSSSFTINNYRYSSSNNMTLRYRELIEVRMCICVWGSSDLRLKRWIEMLHLFHGILLHVDLSNSSVVFKSKTG